jgi:hypothetical protein
MKTPREVLFARHRDAEPQLDAIREAVVRELRSPCARPQSPPTCPQPSWRAGLITLWRELILPSRRIWAGLAAVWLGLGLINLAQRDPASGPSSQPVRPPAPMASWQAQQRWLDELLADRSSLPVAERPRTSPSQPRTEETGVVAV